MKISVEALIINSEEKVLLALRNEHPEVGYWSLIGGSVEELETPHEAVLRKIKEEIGTEARLTGFLGVFNYVSKTDSHEKLSLSYLASVDSTPINLAFEENSEIRWFDLNHLPANLAQPSMFAISKYAKRDVFEEQIVKGWQSDVVLIQPFFPLADKETLSIPLGLAYVHSTLKIHGFSVKSFDCGVETDYVSLCNTLFAINPKVVGIQFHSAMSFEWAKKYCSYVRRVCPNARIIGGGELATLNYEDLLVDNIVDFVVMEEGEITFLQLVQAIFGSQLPSAVEGIAYLENSTNLVTKNNARPFISNLDDLPLPEIADFSWQKYGQWTIFTSRGCPFRCNYCSSAAYWKHSIRYHSARRIVEEMSRLVNDFNARDIYIADDTFTLNKQRIYEMCSLLNQQNIEVRWSCLTRVDCIDEDLLMAMHEAGCVLVSFGVETSNQKTLNLVHKNVSFDKVENAIRLCHKIGIRTRTSIIIGLPNETEQDIYQTLDFLLKFQPKEIQLYGLTPHDGTALYSNLDAFGVTIIENEPSLWSRNVLKPVCETKDLKREQIIEIGLKFIDELRKVGYTYLSENLETKKINADKSVATSFSPVQAIGSVTP